MHTAAQARAVALLSADQAAKEVVFGRFAGTSAEMVRNVGFQKLVEGAQPLVVDLAKLGISMPSGSSKSPNIVSQSALKDSSSEIHIDTTNFAKLWGDTAQQSFVNNSIDPTDPTTPPTLPAKMRLWLRLLRCDDETDPEWLGDDEMAVAGVSINEKGDTLKIAERSAGGGYHDGVEHNLDWNYCEFDLVASNQWPKRLGATLIIAEKDHGGLSDYMQKLWDATSKA